jgi:hypothetical protein
MKARLTDAPREFTTAGARIRDFGQLELAPGDMVVLATASGRQCDVTATAWGFYLAPSLNGRLRDQGFRVALVANPQDKLFLNAVEEDRLEAFAASLLEQGSRVVRWLDGAPAPEGLAGAAKADKD